MEKIFDELQSSQIALSLSKGDLPIKYSYIIPNGADLWNKIEKKEFKTNGNTSYDSQFLVNNLNLYIQEINNDSNKNIIIFDFGCGAGNVLINFFKKLSESKKIYYHAFDISPSLIKKNKSNIKKISKTINFDSTKIDFESGNFFEEVTKARLKYKNGNILGLFLGNTLGNFYSEERILSIIMESLTIDDRLVVGIERVDSSNKRWIDKELKKYNCKEFKLHDFSMLEYLGINTKQLKYIVEFNKRINSIETFVEFLKRTEFKIGKKVIIFEKGERLRVCKSKKINEEEFAKIAEKLNLRIANMRTSFDNNYLQILISNKKFN